MRWILCQFYKICLWKMFHHSKTYLNLQGFQTFLDSWFGDEDACREDQARDSILIVETRGAVKTGLFIITFRLVTLCDSNGIKSWSCSLWISATSASTSSGFAAWSSKGSGLAPSASPVSISISFFFTVIYSGTSSSSRVWLSVVCATGTKVNAMFYAFEYL